MVLDIALVVLAFIFQTTSDYYLDTVTLTSSFLNEHEVLIINENGLNGDYILTCNRDQVGCRTPPPKQSKYLVEIRGEGFYKCQNVGLKDSVSDKGYYGLYCLGGTTPK